MNESDWLSGNNPQAMLNHVEGKVSARKLRLFACACLNLRAKIDTLYTPANPSHYEVAETGKSNKYNPNAEQWARSWAEGPPETDVPNAREKSSLLRHIVGNPWRPWNAVTCLECKSKGHLWNDDEWVCHVCSGRGWLPGPSPTFSMQAIALAEALYAGEDCAFALSDLLEETEQATLADHFRREVNHPRGCWAVDVLLGKS